HTRFSRDWSSDVCSSDLSFGVITPLIGFGSIAAVNAGFAVGAFLATGFGQLLLAGGAAALRMLLRGGGPQQQAPNIEAAKVNVQIGRASCRGRVQTTGAA